MTALRICGGLFLTGVLCLAASGDEPAPGRPKLFEVSRTQFADLGSEHVAHAIFRRTRDGGGIVSWGDRILQWRLEKPTLVEVVAPLADVGYANGGCALDLDGDGNDEIVVARGRGRWANDPDLFWFQETGAGKTWTANLVGSMGKGAIAPHDIQPFAVRRPSGGMVRGVVAVLDRRQLVWYEIPADPHRPWQRHEIAELPLASQSGLAIGNLAGNGRPDVACGMCWAECPANLVSGTWRVRRFGHWDDGGWGGMAKLELADMDSDGRDEIIATEAEIPNARLGVFSRDAAAADGLWKYHEIERGLYCPHSLALADLDSDGRPDIITGEMSAGGWSFPINARPKIIAFLNRGDKPPQACVLGEGNGVHEMGLIPGRKNGAWIIFAADEIQPQKFPGMKTHVSTWSIRQATP